MKVDPMNLKTLELSNVYGYPAFNDEIQKRFSDYQIVITVDSLFSPKFERVKVEGKRKRLMVIDTLSKLVHAGIPIVGYDKAPNGVWMKIPFEHFKVEPNTIQVHQPYSMGHTVRYAAPSEKLLLEVQRCQTDADFQALQGKYQSKIEKPEKARFKWLRRVIVARLNADTVNSKKEKKTLRSKPKKSKKDREE